MTAGLYNAEPAWLPASTAPSGFWVRTRTAAGASRIAIHIVYEPARLDHWFALNALLLTEDNLPVSWTHLDRGDLAAAATATDSEISALLDGVAQILSDTGRILEEISTVSASNSTLNQNLGLLQGTVSSLVTEVHALRDRDAAQTTLLQQFQTQAAQLVQANNALTAQLAAVPQDTTAAETAINNINTQLTNLIAEVDAIDPAPAQTPLPASAAPAGGTTAKAADPNAPQGTTVNV